MLGKTILIETGENSSGSLITEEMLKQYKQLSSQIKEMEKLRGEIKGHILEWMQSHDYQEVMVGRTKAKIKQVTRNLFDNDKLKALLGDEIESYKKPSIATTLEVI